MKVLSRERYQEARRFIQSHGRDLEAAVLTEDAHGIIQALAPYQNEDGGFGNGLESDIRLPHSSAIATSVALQHLKEIDTYDQADTMIQKAVVYLERTFDQQRQGWFAVPPEVNDYPHAFWWSVHENGQSWIDANWGNPSAELIGYLLRYRTYTESLPVDQLIDQAIGHFLSLEAFESEHELYCYRRLFTMHPELYSEPCRNQMKRAVEQVIVRNEEQWKNYVPFPLKFKPAPQSLDVGLTDQDVQQNLDYFVDALEKETHITPPWTWQKTKMPGLRPKKNGKAFSP
ncbi:hypothetical protein [Halobacillus salinus]|uniref:hypothetical protein n=1 Tax=Halobacillus salinus TaxID=192814 RepID=UPI0009A81E23|nr:hypothetical protein [Halobacillus salinus]